MNEVPLSLAPRVCAARNTAYASEVPFEARRRQHFLFHSLVWTALVIAALTLLAAGSARAQESTGTQNGVPFASGGVGIDSQERLNALEKDFNLKLVFTLVEGNYVSDVAVAVKNASGKTLVQHVASGPFFLARLPAGTYTVTATYSDQPQTRKVSVRANHLRTEYLRWKSNPNADFVLPPESGKN